LEYQINFGIPTSQISLRTTQHQSIITNSRHYRALYTAQKEVSAIQWIRSRNQR